MYGSYKSIHSSGVVGAMNVGKFKAILLLSLFKEFMYLISYSKESCGMGTIKGEKMPDSKLT